jgi:ribonuclease HI
MEEWLPGWKAKGWKKKNGPIMNLELWKEADELASRHECRWKWVRGHNGQPQNEFADFLAARAAAEQSNSGGLRESEFDSWVQKQKEGTVDLKNMAPFPDFQSFQPGKRAWTT